MRILGLALSIGLLILAMMSSVIFGVTRIPLSVIWQAVTEPNGSTEHLIIQTARIPRVLIAAAVGGSLAVAGAVMQVLTRNPIASPSTLGVNAGAAFFVVVATGWLGVSGLQQTTWIALLGAAVSGGVVFFLGSMGRDGMTPVKITLAGASMTAFFHSLTQGLMLSDGKMFDQVLIWLVGSVAGRELDQLTAVVPYMGIGLLIALLLSRHLNVLSMGDDIAAGLGQKTAMIKILSAASIILLAGASVAAAGPIAFIGIIIPHIMKFFLPNDYRWILPYSFVWGAVLLVSADVLSRYIAMPKEVPVGVMTAIIGVPFFVYIARKGGRQGA
ncbi:putative siderophore transport system permease protein YfiZ [Paenibacillus sp. J45TS6]|uniref:FecCD family ABC transporter permease n=1 Tax=Paenibacillus sp. J45TS6 TaxID=2807196 RepID=UPI001AFF5154|nr:iron ABC transporter permease [Paenibacillus sp. J45TS6]GIP44510.1 putative siderophore transport system permease protein YfiZ [Paenibacillus sp. J45TS6]